MASENESSSDVSSDSSMIAEDPHSGFIRFEIDNVSNRAPFRICSPEIEVMGMPWKLLVNKLHDSSYLRVFLYHRKSDSNIWSVDVSHETTLVNIDKEKNRIRKGGRTFNTDVPNTGYNQFILWKDVIDEEKGFIKDGKIVIESRFTLSNIVGLRVIPRIDFNDPDEPRHDVALVINGEKIYVNKGVLAVHSPVLSAMFYGNFAERDKKEIELKDIDPKEFIILLNFIYPSYEKITDDNVEFLLKLADRFQIKMIIDKAEQFLIDSTKFDVPSKLQLSDDYRLVKLQEHCLGTFKTAKDIMDLKTNDLFKELSDKAKVALLTKAMNLS